MIKIKVVTIVGVCRQDILQSCALCYTGFHFKMYYIFLMLKKEICMIKIGINYHEFRDNIFPGPFQLAAAVQFIVKV